MSKDRILAVARQLQAMPYGDLVLLAAELSQMTTINDEGVETDVPAVSSARMATILWDWSESTCDEVEGNPS